MSTKKRLIRYHEVHLAHVATLSFTSLKPGFELSPASQYFESIQSEVDFHTRHFEKCPICWANCPQTKGDNERKYLVTFTRNPNTKYTLAQWRAAVHKQIKRDIFLKGHYAFEHEDTNIHCHVLALSTGMAKSNFAPFIRKFGNIDLRSVGKDNGIMEYIGKENEIVSFDNVTSPSSSNTTWSSVPEHPEQSSASSAASAPPSSDEE